MLLSLPDILLLLLVLQLLVVSLYLFSKKTGKPASNCLLGCFFTSIALSMADSFLLRSGVAYTIPEAATIGSAVPFLYGPLLFIYTQSLIYRSFRISLKKLAHLLPFAILFSCMLILYEIQPREMKIRILHDISDHHVSAGLYIIALIIIFHFAGYALAALSAIKKYNRLALNKFSEIQRTNLNWLSATIIFFLVLFALSLVNNLFRLITYSKYHDVAAITIIVLLFYFVNRLLFKALNDPAMFSWVEEGDEEVNIKTGPPIAIPDKTIELGILTRYMQESKPYLNPDLTVETLAKALRMQPKEVSRLINDHLHQNFFDFINRYRIKDAEDLLLNSPDKKITVLEILYKTGFNSKSSFNTLFKKYTGKTPTEYKSRLAP